jgi:hypothetical protein
MNGEEVLQQMNIAEFAGRMREQVDRIEGFANATAKAPTDTGTACFYMIESELDMLQRRLNSTREWLGQRGNRSDGPSDRGPKESCSRDDFR